MRMETSSSTTCRPQGCGAAPCIGRAPGSWPSDRTVNQIAVTQNEPGNSNCRILESNTGRLVLSIKLPSTGNAAAWSKRRNDAGDAV